MNLCWEDIEVAEGDYSETPCECCGKTTIELGGDLEAKGEWLGFYWIRHAKGHPDVLPVIKVGTGNWSGSAPPTERWVFGVEVNLAEGGFGLLDLSADGNDKTATYLDRDDILGSRFSGEAFAMVDAVFMKDSRLEAWRP